MNADKREYIAAVWKEFFAKRDHHSRNILIEHYLATVKYTAQRLHCRLPKSVELDDLNSAGLMGLIKAIDKFDPGRETLFETYCAKRIQGEILDDLRKKDWIPRLVRSRAQQLQKVTQELESILGRTPTDAELAGSLKMNKEEFCHFKRDAIAIGLFSLDGGRCESSTDNELREMDVIANQHSQNPFYEAQKKDLKEYVTQGCSREEKLIIILYYYEQMTMKEIGMVLGISESRVCQIHALIISKLKSHLNRDILIESIPADNNKQG